MKLSGKGSLYIQAKYNNGIHCKDDLKIKPEVKNGSTVQIISYNNCLKGNDSLTIESGKLVLISTNGNAIKTENTDVSSKGKQRGTVTITGGQIDIYSAKDAIDASYNVDISTATEGADPIINIYTSDFSSYSNEVADTKEEQIYLKVSENANTTSYFYAVEFLNADYTTSWAKATLSKTSGGYKYLGVDKPANATGMKVCRFASDVTELSEANANAKSNSYSTINSYYDTVLVVVYNNTIRLDRWSSSSSKTTGGQFGPGGGGGPQQEGNTNKAEVSAKGIKADNIINISGGIFFIKTYDDGIHANYGDAFENGETGVGDVNISGGTFSIYASDDGIHADGTLNISGGNIDVSYSYEAIEATIINLTGGNTRVYAVDDGVNAAQKNNLNPAINISGGLLDVTVYGQDVDGIDSNGTFTQTGGYVITKGANSNMSTGLDCDKTATVSGGTFLSFGRTEKTPTKGSNVTYYSLTGSYSAGTYKITFGDGFTTNTTSKYSCSVINVYSDSTTKITVTKA